MHFKSNKYDVSIRMKRMAILFALIFLQFFVQAQANEKIDTVPVLKYELDTTTIPKLPEEEPPAEETDDEDKTRETKVEAEYFLRKEFTGGLPDTLKFRKLPDNVINALREDKAFWYANESFKKRKKKERVNFTAQPVFQTILWLVIISGFVTFLILYLKSSNAGLFRKSSNIADEEAEIENNDIFSINYQKEITRAVGMNNYRLAVRLMFLRLLRDLSIQNLIQYRQDSTNFDYMMQLRSTRMYPDFFRLARNYEYSWYGQFEIDKEKYSIIKNEFENFERKLK